MLIAAAEEASRADILIKECRYDEAEHWLQQAVRTARAARSDNALIRDVAGSAVGQMTVKLEDFRRQRKIWDHAVVQVRQLLNANQPDMAYTRLVQASTEACDPRFTEFRNELASRDRRAAEFVRLGDDQATRFPRTARDYYLQARAIDPARPGLQLKLLEVERRIPGLCAECDIARARSDELRRRNRNAYTQ